MTQGILSLLLMLVILAMLVRRELLVAVVAVGTILTVGRFVNHSCSPNLIIQRVLVDTHDYRLPRLALFAETDIDPLYELT